MFKIHKGSIVYFCSYPECGFKSHIPHICMQAHTHAHTCMLGVKKGEVFGRSKRQVEKKGEGKGWWVDMS